MLKKFLFLISLVLTCLGFSQSLTNQYDTSAFIGEQIMLFTNKQTYLAGEELECDFLTYDGVYNKPVQISSVAYIDLIGQDGYPLQQFKAEIKGGCGKLKFVISNKLSTDYYVLRVYTQYMRNFAINNYAYHRISVVNTFKYLSSKELIKKESLDLKVNLKNNCLVAGAKNKIGIQLINANPQLFESCKVVDELGVEIVANKNYDEFVFLEFIPSVSKSYFIEIKLGNELIRKSLPLVQNSVWIEFAENELQYIGRLKNIPDGKLYYSIFRNNIKVSRTLIDDSVFAIKKEFLHNGIYCVAIEKENGEILDNAYLFKKYHEMSIPFIKKETLIKNREKYYLNKDTSYSYQINYIVPENTYDNSYIVNPLFVNDVISVLDTISFSLIEKAYLDSNAFEFVKLGLNKPVQVNSNFPFICETEGDIVSGVLRYSENLKPAPNVDLLVTIPDSLHYYLDVLKTNQNGVFNLLIGEYYNSPFFVFSSFDSLQNYSIELSKEFEKSALPVDREMFVPEKKMADYLRNQMLTLQVQDAFASSLDSIPPVKDANFYGQPNKVVFFDDFIKLPVFEEYVKELMTGVYVIKKKKKKYLRISNFDGQGYTGENPLLIVNGVHVRNHQTVLNLNPKEVDYVRIVNHIILFKDLRFDGVFEVVLKKDIDFNKLNNKNLFIEDYITPYKPLIELNKTVSEFIPIFQNSLRIQNDKQHRLFFTTTDQKDQYESTSYNIDHELQIKISTEKFIVK